MAKFLARRLMYLLFTMILVSIVVFVISELAPGNIVRHMLGQFATPEQEKSLRRQLGLDRPAWKRYVSWLIGSDFLWARPRVGMPLRRVVASESGSVQWWAVEDDGSLICWKYDDADLIATQKSPGGSTEKFVDNERFKIDAEAEVKRITEIRDRVRLDSRLVDEDRETILHLLDGLLALLQRQGLTGPERDRRVRTLEQRLLALTDDETQQQREAIQRAGVRVRGTLLLETLTLAERLEAGESLSDEALRNLPNRLSLTASLLEDSRPEVSERLRQAAKYVVKRDTEGAQATLSALVEPLRSLAEPIVELGEALEREEYIEASGLLRQLLPSASIADEVQIVVLVDPLEAMEDALQDGMPEMMEALSAASENLESGDVVATREKLDEAADILVDRAPDLARDDVAREAQVGRYFWGVDHNNHAVLWKTRSETDIWFRAAGGKLIKESGGAVRYIPLQKGLLRGDFGESTRTRQPVGIELWGRLRNSLMLAAVAFAVVMPLALLLGIVAGLNEGKLIDRVLSLFGLITTASPNFATGIGLILLFSVWLGWLPGATVFTSSDAVFRRPEMLVLPVATLTLIELGYVLRMTRASMAEVMSTPYVRTAILKGLPYREVVLRYAVRNALMAPITVIMLHVNWLLGGIVVVEAIFGYPGLGTYLLTSALYKDVFAIEAGAMVMVVLAVSTQLIADVVYTFLNPRIRYS
jgi:peptide/nickel transport system permease protein